MEYLEKPPHETGRLVTKCVITSLLLIGGILFTVFGYLGEEKIKESLYAFLVGGALIGSSVMMLSFRTRMYYVEAYGWREQTVRKDIKNLVDRRGLLALGFGVIAFLYWITWLLGGSEKLPAFFVLAALFLVWRFVRWYRLCALINSDQIRITQDTFVRQYSTEDADGHSRSYLVFCNAETQIEWECRATCKQCTYEEEGSIVESVYLGRQRKPCLIYYPSMLFAMEIHN